ncbi:Uncharacterised protein [Vibrio cholerae]|nr:Uncharacterised protein [Vibrio cholerae]
MRRAAAPVKQSRGKVVTTPAQTKSRLSCQVLSAISLVGVSASQIR